jgi:hypothetical protein
VLSQQGSRFGCGAMAAGGPWSGLLFSGMEGVVEIGSGAGGGRDVAGCSPPQLLQEPAARALPVASSVGSASGGAGQDAPAALAVTATAAAGTGRRKRRRMRPLKNEEEVESQRMVHIAVERNRRKQMNEYLAALRSLMPPAYTQRVTDELDSDDPRASHARPFLVPSNKNQSSTTTTRQTNGLARLPCVCRAIRHP